MKYKLLKDLPLAEAGTEVFIYSPITSWFIDIRINEGDWYFNISCLKKEDIPEWLEEVKEPKTIYDLKRWDTYWWIDTWNQIDSSIVIRNNQFDEENTRYSFVTEREAKRNKLLRELATRTDKWLPNLREDYYTYFRNPRVNTLTWYNDCEDFTRFHSWFVFRNEEEFNKYMTEENKDLLFNI